MVAAGDNHRWAEDQSITCLISLFLPKPKCKPCCTEDKDAGLQDHEDKDAGLQDHGPAVLFQILTIVWTMMFILNFLFDTTQNQRKGVSVKDSLF